MIRMHLEELTIYRNKKNFIDLLSVSPHVKIEGSVSSSDIQEISDMFYEGPIYLMTAAEVNHYLALKHEREVREAETKEEENNEEHN